MTELSGKDRELKKNWKVTPGAFDRLLNWLDQGADSDGEKYLEMRRRLIAYFDRKNCLDSDELADETLNRVSRRLEEEEKLDTDAPAKYCYTTARFVFMESLRQTRKSAHALNEIERQQYGQESVLTETSARSEVLLDCLERCTGELTSANRELITKYYVGKERLKIENRRSLANGLGITMNALSIRACRIRDKLEVCIRQCAAE